jgi:hypothetical protein
MIEKGLQSLYALIQMYQVDSNTIDKIGILSKQLYTINYKISQSKNRFVLVGLKYKKRKLEKQLIDIQNGN